MQISELPKITELIINNQTYAFHYYEGLINKFAKQALKHQLYEKFDGYTSQFQRMFEGSLYYLSWSAQIFILKENEPIGICLAIDYDQKMPSHVVQVSRGDLIKGQNNPLILECVGQIGLFIKPPYRHQGLASHVVPILEKKLLEKIKTDYPPVIIMQDNALKFRKFLKIAFALPGAPSHFLNFGILKAEYLKLINNPDKLDNLLNDYPVWKESVKEYKKIHPMTRIKINDNRLVKNL